MSNPPSDFDVDGGSAGAAGAFVSPAYPAVAKVTSTSAESSFFIGRTSQIEANILTRKRVHGEAHAENPGA